MQKEALSISRGLIGILSEKGVFYSEEDLERLENYFPDEIRQIHYGSNNGIDYIVIKFRKNNFQLEMIRDLKAKKYYVPREFMND